MGRSIEATPGFCILWAFLILTLPLKFLLAAATAALVHESFHAAAVRLCGGRILGLTLGAGGMVMEVSFMGAGRELACALAGPMGSLLLACLPLNCLALCGLVQGSFNLLPLMPLDGGRVLGCLLELSVPRHRRRIEGAVSMLTWCALLAAAHRLGMDWEAVMVAPMILFRKFPCKPWGKRVQ